MTDKTPHQTLLSLTTEIVASFAAGSRVASHDLPPLIASVFGTLSRLGEPEAAPPKALEPAVPVKKSIAQDFIICLEDGKKLKMLKRHLASRYNLTPDDYRRRWGLPASYPMVAPGYAAQRSAVAKRIGLGRKPAAPAPEPAPKAPGRRAAGRKAAPA